MPLQDWMKIISVDDHVIEHPRVWQDRLAEQDRVAGPQIVETPEGHHVWRYEGKMYPQIGLNAVAGKPREEYGMEPVRYDHMIPGCYDPAERIKDMDIDGVHGALCFPSFPGFGGGVFQRAEDKHLALRCIQAWNDFQTDEWCASAPGRLIPLGLLPLWDPVLTAREIERLAAKGTRAVSMPESPAPLNYPSYHHPTHWEVVWDALEAADMPVCLHFGSCGYAPGFSFAGPPKPEEPAPFAVAISTFSTNLMWATADLVFSGLLQRHPRLKFMLSEGGIGWIPYLLERLDATWERHRWYQDISRTDRPSDLFRRHIWGCFIDDDHGVASRDTIGIDRILIEVDYPHSDSNWPNSRKRIEETLVGLSDEDTHAIVELNARRLLHVEV